MLSTRILWLNLIKVLIEKSKIKNDLPIFKIPFYRKSTFPPEVSAPFTALRRKRFGIWASCADHSDDTSDADGADDAGGNEGDAGDEDESCLHSLLTFLFLFQAEQDMESHLSTPRRVIREIIV